ALVLGWIVPLAWLLSASHLCPSIPPLGKELFTGTLWPQAIFTVTAILVATAIGFYVSSFSRDTLRAIVGTAGLFVAFGFILPFIAKVAQHWLQPIPDFVGFLQPISPPIQRSSVRVYLALLAGVLVLLWFLFASLFWSFRHFKRLNHNSAELLRNTVLAYSPGLVLFFLFSYLSAGLDQ